MFNAFALYTSRGLLKMWSPRGLFLIRMPPPAMLGLLWVYLQLPKAKQSIVWERLFSTTRSYVCLSPLHFYASFPLTRLVHVHIHVPAWLDSPSPLAVGRQAWDEMGWTETLSENGGLESACSFIEGEDVQGLSQSSVPLLILHLSLCLFQTLKISVFMLLRVGGTH